jgi:transposase
MKFKDWCKRGIWRELFKILRGNPDGESFMLDATIVRAHACSAGQAKDPADKEALGRSCGGFSTKVHAMVDALGNPVAFSLTPGQHHDQHGMPLTKNLKNTVLLADKGYDSDMFLKRLEQQGVKAVIPTKKTVK